MSDATPIVVRGLTKRYPLAWRRGQVVALDRLDLEVRRGEVFGLLGPNGSGKSTTLKLILGLVRATAGEVLLFDESFHTAAARRRLGFLPENPYFHRFLTGAETLRFYGRVCGVTGARLEARINELLALVGLEHGRDRPLRTYSKGMLQRIGLAQALVHDPELLLLDEATAGVDPLGSREIKDLILHLKQLGKTIVLSSHLLDQVEEVCDRVVILHLGRKVLEGRLEDLLQVQDRMTLTVAGLDETNEARAREALAAAGVSVEEVRRPRLTLERLFLETVGLAGNKGGSKS
jgi:ABC-2 type transport system ATP-binding protein